MICFCCEDCGFHPAAAEETERLQTLLNKETEMRKGETT